MMETLFWLSLGLIGYVYVGYPLLLGAWALLVATPDLDEGSVVDRAVDACPPVSVIIAARNEARQLPARIDNLLASDYPQDRIQIIVGSDGSTDGTVGALAPSFQVRPVGLLAIQIGIGFCTGRGWMVTPSNS